MEVNVATHVIKIQAHVWFFSVRPNAIPGDSNTSRRVTFFSNLSFTGVFSGSILYISLDFFFLTQLHNMAFSNLNHHNSLTYMLIIKEKIISFSINSSGQTFLNIIVHS